MAFDNRIALAYIRTGLARKYPMLLRSRSVEQVDAYIIADPKKWAGIRRTLSNFSAFPNCTLFLDYNDVPDAEKELIEMGFPRIVVVRYHGGNIRKAVRFAEQYAKAHSDAYVISDADMLSPMILKIINPRTMKLLHGGPITLPAGSVMRGGKVRKMPRESYRTFGEGPLRSTASPETFYQVTLLAFNIARASGYSGVTFSHQSRPHDGYNGYNNIGVTTEAVCQGNFRGWFADAEGSYADVPDEYFDANLEDAHRTFQASKPGKTAMMTFRLADIKYHVDKKRQANSKHKKMVYRLRDMFKALEIEVQAYTTRETKAYSLR